MKVKRLIEELSKMNPNASVRVSSEYGSPVMFVLSCLNNENVVWLESVDDCNIKDQIKSRINDANINMEPDESLFKDLFEHDVTANMVRIYVGENIAKRYEQYLNTVNGQFI